MQRNMMCAVLIVGMLASTLLAYSGGSGTAEDPYQIATAEDLIALGATPDDYDKHFILTADIDLDPNLPGRKIFDRAIIAPASLIIPGRAEYSFEGLPFSGSFDGQGHKIQNAFIQGQVGLGLFGSLAPEAYVSNLLLQNVNITGTHDLLGALVAYNQGTIMSSSSTGSVSGERCVGGLVGKNQGTITSSYSTGSVCGEWSVGGLVGRNQGTITSSHSTGSVSGEWYVGGLTGDNRDTIASSYNAGNVTGDLYVGGLVGVNDGTITSSYNTGSVTGNESVGGLVGGNDNTITSCYSTGTVDGGYSVGGFVGRNYGTIASCYSTGGVRGDDNVGGLVGLNCGAIASCYSTGGVRGDDDVGGLVGLNCGAIASCYSIGGVRGDGDVGGLVGINWYGTIVSSFWAIKTSGQTDSDGGTGLTTAVMLDIDTFLAAGWDFIDESPNGTEDTWFMPTGNYPGLTWSKEHYTTVPDVVGVRTQQAEAELFAQGFCVSILHHFDNTVPEEHVVSQDHEAGQEILAGTPVAIVVAVAIDGIGTEEDPYRIVNARQLMALGETPSFYDRDFVLCADIDLSNYIFNRAIIAPDAYDDSDYQGTEFSGSFNGQGHTISHLRIQGTNHLGLFGKCSPDAAICCLGLEAVDISGTGDFVGGLVGDNDGRITSSYSTGSVIGVMYVGGLVGGNNGTIKSSYSTGSVSGDLLVGGLVGYCPGTITLSYSTGSVRGGYSVGGIVGYCSNGITSIFWDIETSGCHTSQGGIGLTTAEMMDAEMMGLNGLASDPNWILDPGRDYPRLAWEGTAGEPIPEPVIDWLDGSGTAEDPYQIASVSQLQLIGKASLLVDRCFELVNSLDLSGLVWSQAVIPYFDGGFNGNGHVLSHLVIEGQRYLGLFGILGPNAEVSTLGLEEVDIKGTRYIGGLVGDNWSPKITSCYSTGILSGDSHVGGLVGINDGGTITSSYSTGSVRGGWYVGGLIGDNWSGVITSCYSTGSVTDDDGAGGFLGGNWSGTITSCCWDIETSGRTGSEGGIGLTTAEMMDAETLGLNGLAADPNWILDPGRDYPRLAWEGTAGEPIPEPVIDWLDGSGTPEDPYQIANVSQLQLISKASLLADRCFELVDSLDLAGLVWPQAVIPYFDGCFDGNGHRLSHLVIEGQGHLGLFGILGPNAEVLALGLEEVDIKSSGSYVGGLTGDNHGAITSSYSTGSVSGYFYTGGFVGDNYGTITSSYSTGSVSGQSYVGGLTGDNYGAITSSYSTGSVSGYFYTGGFVGDNEYGTITSSYSAGSISGSAEAGGFVGVNTYGTIMSSFWDIETSGQADSAGGTGLTTAEMQTAGTFLDAGWDFVGETDNGVEDIWWMPEQDYPRLWWEALD